MTTTLLATKLYIPAVRPDLVPRRHLIERLDAGRHRKLTLVSAPAGFGKTTLLSEWVRGGDGGGPPLPVAWLSLDEGDNDPARFLAYLVAALQTVEEEMGKDALGALQSPQPPPRPAVPRLSSGNSLVASGKIVPAQEAQLGFTIAGRVQSLAVALDDEV